MNFDSFYFNIIKETALEERVIGEIQIESTCFLVRNNYIGDCDSQLGQGLIKSLFYVMTEKETKPSDIILINKGVLLAADGSPVLSALRELERTGVSILCCGSSLNYYKAREGLAIGYVSNMYDILEVLMRARKVITI